MALNLFNRTARLRDQVVAIDLGGRTTKAVYMQRTASGYALSRYALSDAPIYEKNVSADLLGEHIKAVCQTLDLKTKLVTLALGVNDSLLRHADLPPMPIGDMRLVLKLNTKNYLQQDLPGHLFDCYIMPPRAPKADEKGKTAGPARHRVLAAGARAKIVEEIQAAVKCSGLTADAVVPGLIGPVNAFELAMPEIFAKEAVALIDIGFKNTTVCLLQEGELILSRVVPIGGDKMTSGLSEVLGISYAEAESIKLGIPGEVETQLQSLLLPLTRELRASIDCFEHQQDRAISGVYVSGATSRSEFIMRALQNDLMIECKVWNPLSTVELDLPQEQKAELETISPQLAVAVGAALSTF